MKVFYSYLHLVIIIDSDDDSHIKYELVKRISPYSIDLRSLILKDSEIGFISKLLGPLMLSTFSDYTSNDLQISNQILFIILKIFIKRLVSRSLPTYNKMDVGKFPCRLLTPVHILQTIMDKKHSEEYEFLQFI